MNFGSHIRVVFFGAGALLARVESLDSMLVSRRGIESVVLMRRAAFLRRASGDVSGLVLVSVE